MPERHSATVICVAFIRLMHSIRAEAPACDSFTAAPLHLPYRTTNHTAVAHPRASHILRLHDKTLSRAVLRRQPAARQGCCRLPSVGVLRSCWGSRCVGEKPRLLLKPTWQRWAQSEKALPHSALLGHQRHATVAAHAACARPCFECMALSKMHACAVHLACMAKQASLPPVNWR